LGKFSFYQPEESREESKAYEGLDTMRVVSSFGVVFLHVCSATGLPGSLEWMMKFRDFALPVMVMSSFYVLTVSLVRKPDKDFERFFSRRFTRLWIPLFIWTLFYTIFTIFLIPFLSGLEPSVESFSPVVFFSGYRHLWYLQFIFIGSLAVYPVLSRISGIPQYSRGKIFLFCICGTFFYWILFRSLLENPIWPPFDSESDINLQIFAAQASRYLLYIPAAVGLGLMRDKIDGLFRNAFYRKLSLVLTVIAMLLHTAGSTAVPATQEIYGIAVFLAALQPWKKVAFDFWHKLIDHSYGIYILHFFPVHLLWLVTAYYNLELNAAAICFSTLIVFILSFSATAFIRKIFPADWLLPPVKENQNRASQTNFLQFSPANER
jgi:peptidoglycan/LPS O-acetylase OafA/YrhL